MKTFTKILRGTITSLLFLTLTLAILVQFIFTNVHLNYANLPSMIDRKELLATALDTPIEDETIYRVAERYLDDYINYIFHKRSFPSLQTVDYSEISEEQIQSAKEVVSHLSKNINLEYAEVTDLRDLNNVLSNRAIFLLVNIGVFLIYVVSSIVRGNFKKGTRLLALSLVANSLISLVASRILISKLPDLVSPHLYTFLSAIVNAPLKSQLTNLALIYGGLGLSIYILIFSYDRFLKPRD